MNPAWIVRTARLTLQPVGWRDLPELKTLKSDPRVFAMMLGGVRGPVQAAEELAADLAFWAARRVGMWSARHRDTGAFLGIVGLMERPDGLGTALRFGFWPDVRGRGLAREAAGAALRFAHEQAELERVIAVAREDNFASRIVLGAIGMAECAAFNRAGNRMLIYASTVRPEPCSA